jgi:flagellar basal-body rod protein FlgC
MGGLINAIGISAQGLSAQRAKMNVVAQNMANAETVETAEGGPYQRRRVIVTEDKRSAPFTDYMSRANTRLTRTHAGHRPSRMRLESGSIKVSTVEHEEIVDPESNFRLVHDPTHPNADAEGFVKMPDVDVVHEMVDMMAASRAYEANTSVIASAKKMANDALEI